MVVYTGDPGDPLNQQMRLVRATSLEQARLEYPDAIMVALFENPKRQEPPNLARLKRGMSVWSF